MKRRDFIWRTFGMILGLAGLRALVGCSDSDDGLVGQAIGGPGASVNCLANGTRTTIESNHGHSLLVSVDDIKAGTEKSYSIQGSSGHNHLVTLSEDNFTSLRENGTIEVNSTTSAGHDHSIIVSCA
ncbi:hypothetical protein [Poritiphilus flavus]|uniref:Uncharacterized protein n=1 Tax=Poritiphilus flavus TaxID=2697053 RepID=A0A6L9EE28_9FLAO|nr:hypothetical protein [Poritiphilus flavus]NAS12975.1 hypothetical protein [Poritiphilus flavus]